MWVQAQWLLTLICLHSWSLQPAICWEVEALKVEDERERRALTGCLGSRAEPGTWGAGVWPEVWLSEKMPSSEKIIEMRDAIALGFPQGSNLRAKGAQKQDLLWKPSSTCRPHIPLVGHSSGVPSVHRTPLSGWALLATQMTNTRRA